MIVGYRAPAHERWYDWHTGNLGKFHQKRRCLGVDNAAARDDERPLGVVQHGERPLDLGAVGGGLVDRQRLIGIRVELHLRHLHVERQIN